jgi:hypothetical protein
LIALELLRYSLPDSIIIYVKEHPRQFDALIPDLRKLNRRPGNFYNKIISLNNTFLININSDSNELISKSKIVATVSGSAGWEAILKGKPAFIFGRPWYSSCKSCFVISESLDIVKSLELINNISLDQYKNNLTMFIDSLEGKIFDAYIGDVYFVGDKKIYNRTIQEFARNLNLYLNSINN